MGIMRHLLESSSQKIQEDGLIELCQSGVRYTLNASPVSPYMRAVLGESLAEKINLYLQAGYWPQLNPPRTFSEKIIHRKLFTNKKLFCTVSDKWAVREYVAQKVGSHVLNEVYHITDDPATIDFDELPKEFVIKATHGSSMSRIVDDKTTADIEQIEKECYNWLSEPFGEILNEYWYQDIEPQIMIERRLHGLNQDIPLDYKFFVFHGEVKLIDVDFNRFNSHKIRFFNKDWEPQDFRVGYPLGEAIDPPEQLDEMIKIAETLADEFEFARVDLYQPSKDEIVFGEITLAPDSGYYSFEPVEKDFEIGSYW